MDSALRSFRTLLIRLLNDQEGQAIVEYILMLSLVATFVAILAKGFKAPLQGLWHLFTQEIAAPCPGCPSPIP